MAYDKNTDYQELINKAVAAGDYTSAAKYEQQRNEKIAGLNSSGTNTYGATATNNYSGYLGSGSSSSGGASSGSSYSGTASSGVKVANKSVQADMSRNTAYAGQTVWKNGYAITYDENGYATKAVRSESPSYSGHTDQTVANNGYTIDQSGTVVDQMALDRATAAQQNTGVTSYYDKDTGTYKPIVSAPATNVAGQQTAVQVPTVTTPGGSSFQQGAGTGASGGDYSEYLKDLYAANMEAELAGLESAYKANVGTLETAGERIGDTYRAARNQAAAQSEVERQGMQEYFAARGLNTGAAGQMELSRSAALQGQLGALSAEEAQAITENQREIDELSQQYELAIAQAKAEGNAALAQALYDEMVRQENAKISAQLAAQEQANWEKQFALTQQQYQDSLTAADRENAYNMAMTMLSMGVMPDAATLDSAGIPTEQAAAIQALAQQKGEGGGDDSGVTAYGQGEYALYLDAMNSGMDPRTYVKSYYKAYGLSVLPNESAYETWEKSLPDQLGSSAFQTWLNKVNINLSESTLDSVDKMVSQYWPVLTDAQRESVQQLFSDYGQTYRYE